MDIKRAVREAYEDTLATQAEIAAKFNISRQTLNQWAKKGEWTSRKIFNEIRAMYETLGMNIKELAKKYKMNENYLRYIKTRQNWVKRRITKDLEEKEIKEILGDKLTEKNMDLFLDTKKEEVKEVLKQSLDHLNLDPIVLEAITETTSDELLLKAMNTAYIKKQILFCAVVARGELIKMIKRASLTNNEKDSANIIVAAEKVSKLFIDAGVSLFGKEQIQIIESNNNDNVVQMNMSDLLALANSSVGVDSVSGGYGSEAVESEALATP
ncbi:DNA-binding protein [Helicobacter pylori]|nr:DNA-binding protein [Helicobacter pylori]